MQRLISVILPVYNERISWIECAVNSILQQTYPALELIVVLDNPARQDAKSLMRAYQQTDSRVIFFQNETNLGLARSLNEGARLARGHYLARMDADDVALCHRLECQLHYMESHPEVGLSGCQVIKIDEQFNRIGLSDSPQEYKLLKKMSRFVNIATHPTMIIRRDLFDRLGGYRNLPGGEDYDLALRAIDSGAEVTNLPDVLLHYRVRTDGETNARSGIQKLCFKYAQALRRQRQKTGTDRFDAAHIRAKIAGIMEKYGDRQDQAQRLLTQARKALAAGKNTKACLLLLRSCWVSPIQRAYYWDWLRAEIIRKLYARPLFSINRHTRR